MPQDGVRDLFLEINRQFNDDISELAAAATTGPGPSASLLGRVRDTATAAHTRLLALDPGDVLIAANTAKVVTHLDLFLTTLDAASTAPLLTRKLLLHLLEEQLEITTVVASLTIPPSRGREEANPTLGPAAAAQAVAAPPVAGDASSGAAADTLGGGRSPLTVGSLIGR